MENVLLSIAATIAERNPRNMGLWKGTWHQWSYAA
jgi:hypothetical protein